MSSCEQDLPNDGLQRICMQNRYMRLSILPEAGGVLMTNSAKFAHYGPANTGFEVV